MRLRREESKGTAQSRGAAHPRPAHIGRRSKRLELAALILVLCLGGVLRAAYLAELEGTPDLEHPPVDSGFSLYWARGLATGDWTLPPEANGRDPRILTTAYLRPPGYPFVLAGFHLLTSGHPIGMRALQAMVGVGSIFLAWLLGRLLLGRAVALVWAALMATSWHLVYFDCRLHGAFLIVALTLALMLLLWTLTRRPSVARGAAVGAVFALLALVRPNILVFAPVCLLWGWWALGRRHRRLELLGAAGAAAIAGALILAIPVARNYHLEKRIVPVSANGGLTFYAGFNDEATGFSTSRLAGIGLFASPWHSLSVVEKLGEELGPERTVSHASAHLRREAVRWIVANPGAALWLVARKVALFWGPNEIAHNRAVATDRAESPLLRRLPMTFSVTLAGALIGLAIAAQQRARQSQATWAILVAMILFVATWFLSFLPFFVASLYRVPIIPYLLLGCSVAAVHLGRLFWTRDRRALALSVALVLTWAAVRVPLVDTVSDRAKWHSIRGWAWTYDSKPELAENEFRLALASDPNSWSANNGLGKVLLAAGRSAEAARHFNSALEAEPDDPVARYNLGIVYSLQGDWTAAAQAFTSAVSTDPSVADAYASLGVALEHLSQRPGAARAYERALALVPGHRLATNNLAWLLATAPEVDLRDGQRAITLAESLMRSDPDPHIADTLAAAYAEAGRFDEAIETARSALARADEADPQLAAKLTTRLQLYIAHRPFRVR